MRFEWRSRLDVDGDQLNDAVVAVDESKEQVVQVWAATPELLTDFLNDMEGFVGGARGTDSGRGVPVPGGSDSTGLGNWGDLVMSRSDTGQVLDVDPARYWDGLAHWFRSRGSDPHQWTALRRRALTD